MKLPIEIIAKLSHTIGDLTKKEFEKEWFIDDNPYRDWKDCYCLHTKDNDWLELTQDDFLSVLKANPKDFHGNEVYEDTAN